MRTAHNIGILKPFGTPTVHSGTLVIAEQPLHVLTPEQQWAYAVSFRAGRLDGAAAGADSVLTRVELEVMRGRVGVGWTDERDKAFVVEKFLGPGTLAMTLVTPASAPLGRLVFRNAEPGATRSEFRVKSCTVQMGSATSLPYLVSVTGRDVAGETPSAVGDVRVFDDEAAAAINHARLSWLETADLPVRGKSVLDAGCGVGHFADFYVSRGCRVVGIDGRPENVAELKRRQPSVGAFVADVQQSLDHLGRFDVVHCFGLLYHLDSPIAALRNFSKICNELVVLETTICDAFRPLAVLADEPPTVNQALAGIGSRPTPSFVVFALNRIGFSFVYGASRPPEHPDFQFDWRDNYDVQRDGHNLRCMFVASRSRLELPALVSLVEQ
jgi:SAM-dependent methyltransferase